MQVSVPRDQAVRREMSIVPRVRFDSLAVLFSSEWLLKVKSTKAKAVHVSGCFRGTFEGRQCVPRYQPVTLMGHLLSSVRCHQRTGKGVLSCNTSNSAEKGRACHSLAKLLFFWEAVRTVKSICVRVRVKKLVVSFRFLRSVCVEGSYPFF